MANPKKAYIVNLSCLHKLYPIHSAGFAAFANLYQHYYSHHFLSYLAYPVDLVRVGIIYYKNQHTINNYKLGKITTEEFKREMLKAFDFLQNKENAQQLLIDAWNKIIDFDPAHDEKIKSLFEKAKQEEAKVFIVSNTNELNVRKILGHFYTIGGVAWNNTPNISCEKSPIPIQLTEDGNICLCLSYRYGEFKSPELQQTLPAGTPSLLQHIVRNLKDMGYTESNIKVISQFSGDMQEAKTLGLPAEKDEMFFSSLSPDQQARPN